jgi:hypothetical protein
MNQAAQNLVKRQDKRLDYLLEQPPEPRLRTIVTPMVIGANFIPLKADLEDLREAEDLDF